MTELRRQGFRYRLMPSPAEESALAQAAGSCRWIWNEAITLQETLREAGMRRMTFAGLSRMVTYWRHIHPWLAAGSSNAQIQVVRNIDRAYREAFTAGKGFPQRKKRGQCRDGFRERKDFGTDARNGRVRIPKIGWIRYRDSRPVLGEPKQLHVTRGVDGWYVAIQTERAMDVPAHPLAASVVGVDLGIARFATCSDGVVIEPTNAFRWMERRIARAQRSRSRKVRYSKNWQKQQRRIARLSARASNMRAHHLHVASTAIAKSHGTVVLEDLQVASMSAAGGSRKRGLNKSILDQGWYAFRDMLTYKTVWNGGRLITVPAPYTSQTCPACGHVARENRPSQAVFACVACGYSGHADYVASLNILAAGHAVIACGGYPDVTGPSKQEPTRRTARVKVPLLDCREPTGGCQTTETPDNSPVPSLS